MRRFLAFWWECILSAQRGSAALANDWQWLVGFPVLAAILYFLRAYLSTDTQQLLSGTTAFGTFMAALLAFFLTLFCCFLIRLIIKPSNLFYREKDRADLAEQELRRRLAHKISVFLDPDCAGVRVVQTRVPKGPIGATGATGAPLPVAVPQQRGPDSKWVQVMVISATDAPLVECEVRLVRVERINENGSEEAILTEPTFCTWSRMSGDEQRRMTIPARIPQAANIFTVQEGDQHLYVQTAHIHYGFDEEIQKPGTYRLALGVSAKDCPTEMVSLMLEWGGSYENITVIKG
jgi:hypothetical protein